MEPRIRGSAIGDRFPADLSKPCVDTRNIPSVLTMQVRVQMHILSQLSKAFRIILDPQLLEFIM